MARAKHITMDMLTRELAKTQTKGQADGVTAQELADFFGIGLATVHRKYLQPLHRAGRLVFAGYRIGVGMVGQVVRTPVYKLVG